MKEQGIEEIFKSALNNFEADVDPSVWTNVQGAINAPTATPAQHGANGSVAGKAGAVAGKLGVKAIVAIVTAVTGVSVGTYFLLSDTQSKKVVAPTVQTQQPAAQIVPQQQPPLTKEQEQSGTSVITRSSSANKVAPESKVNDEKNRGIASPINNAQVTQASAANATTSAKPLATTKPTDTKERTPSKPSPEISTPPPATAKDNDAKSGEDEPAPENHTFQNGFVNINDYIDDEASVTKGLPNVFTPNGDGKDDEFKINTKNLKSLMVMIYDKTGKLIYQWNGLEGKWDGNLANGQPAPVGIYSYSVLAETVDGKTCIGGSPLTLTR